MAKNMMEIVPKLEGLSLRWAQCICFKLRQSKTYGIVTITELMLASRSEMLGMLKQHDNFDHQSHPEYWFALCELRRLLEENDG